MKKLLLFSIMIFATISLVAQTVPRQMVILEIATGTWCTYCPGAAMGADDLLENGAQVAVIENHNGDAFANVYSNARNSYYNVPGFPDSFFDGILNYYGGNHTTSLLPQFAPKYNQRISTPSNIAMSMAVTNVDTNYTVVVTMTKVGTLNAANLVMQFCITQSNIQFAWQGQSHLEHVNRLMLPDANGTAISFTGGDVQTVTLNFSLGSTVALEDIEFIAFVQANTGKEIQQGIKRAAIDLAPGFQSDVNHVNKGGTVNFTNTTTGGYIGSLETYSWTFPGGTPTFSTDENPSVVYNDCGEHDVTYIVNRGGQIDTIFRPAFISVGPTINIAATPDDTVCANESITLDATTPNATSYFWLPGGAMTPTLTVDTAGIGAGLHTYTVTVGLPECPTNKSISVFFDNCTGISDVPKSVTTSVYPNPNNGTFTVDVQGARMSNAVLKVVNSLGMTVYQENNLQVNENMTKTISLKNQSAGIYFLVLQSGNTRITQKIFVR